MSRDVVIVGAGVAGLALARALRAEGRDVLVLERARGTGGRCASRRLDERPVDHGLPFLHGRSPQFRALLDAVDDVTRLAGWPTLIDGDGSPCRPEAFGEHEYRVAFVEGVNRLAKYLARDVEVQVNAEVASLRGPTSEEHDWELVLTSGDRIAARHVVLTIPAPAAAELVRRSERVPADVARLLPLIDLVRMLPCLTVMARYDEQAPRPAWEISLPRASGVIHSIVHDSRKRPGGTPLTLVIQSRPAFSRAHQDDAPDTWAALLLDQAATLHGDWIRHPQLTVPHRWRKARVDPGTELSQPVVAQLPGGGTLGFAGDGFHYDGGIEGAYLSGLAMAERLRQAR